MKDQPQNAIDPLEAFLARSGTMILDGGLATELEFRGYDLSDDLWSARLLIDEPEAITQVHYDYLVAGADCIISASYQGTIAGFMRRGLSHQEAKKLLKLSVELAVEARDRFWADPTHRAGRVKPLVAASIGPYGAFLADGSEFTGAYDLTKDGLLDFHRPRWQILTESAADIMACETIPSLVEAQVLTELFLETPGRSGWISFSCEDSSQLNDGTPIRQAAAMLDPIDNIKAIGINCTSPEYIEGLIGEVHKSTHKSVVVYPNSGEVYDPVAKKWRGEADTARYADACELWRDSGASIIGGCCRTRPEHIRLIRKRLIG